MESSFRHPYSFLSQQQDWGRQCNKNSNFGLKVLYIILSLGASNILLCAGRSTKLGYHSLTSGISLWLTGQQHHLSCRGPRFNSRHRKSYFTNFPQYNCFPNFTLPFFSCDKTTLTLDFLNHLTVISLISVWHQIYCTYTLHYYCITLHLSHTRDPFSTNVCITYRYDLVYFFYIGEGIENISYCNILLIYIYVFIFYCFCYLYF